MSAPQSLLERLQSLYRHLGDEGWHVHANTVALVMDEIEKRPVGRPKTITDMRAYKRDKAREYRSVKREVLRESPVTDDKHPSS